MILYSNTSNFNLNPEPQIVLVPTSFLSYQIMYINLSRDSWRPKYSGGKRERCPQAMYWILLYYKEK